MADKNTARSDKGQFVKADKVEVGNERPPEADDFFRYDSKDPKYHYHWATNDPRRIRELQRKGYEVDPAASSSDAAGKVEAQRAYLKRAINDPNASKEAKEMNKEILSRMESAPVDTVVNIPQHIMMRTPMENRRRIMAAREDKSRKMEEKIEADIRDLNKAMQRSGKGGIQAFKDLFDSIQDRKRR